MTPEEVVQQINDKKSLLTAHVSYNDCICVEKDESLIAFAWKHNGKYAYEIVDPTNSLNHWSGTSWFGGLDLENQKQIDRFLQQLEPHYNQRYQFERSL